MKGDGIPLTPVSFHYCRPRNDFLDEVLVQHVCIRLPIRGVTIASGGFEPATAQDVNFPAMIFYETTPLQCVGRRRDAHPADSEHVCQKFVRDVKVVGLSAILRH